MAKTGRFRCSTCGRTFAMAAHLGRHTSTVHAPKGKRVARATGQRPPTTVQQAVGDRLGQLLYQLQASHAELAAQRVALDSLVTALDQAIAALGGSVAAAATTTPSIRRRARRRRTVQAGSLRAYIQQVMRAHRGPRPVKDVTAAVLKAGYKSRDKELWRSVGKRLRAMPGVVRVRPGVFRRK